jgi:hypothetical protein
MQLYGAMMMDNVLASQMSKALDNLHLRRSWFAFIPSRLGRDRIVDTCAIAVLRAHDSYFLQDEPTAASGREQYLHAVSLVRKYLCTSDGALLSVALLALFETLTSADPRTIYAHVNGLHSIIGARPRDAALSDLARAILYASADEQTLFSCARMITSPFDSLNEHLISIEPASHFSNSSADIMQLQKLAHELYLRLPGLVNQTRQCRECATDDERQILLYETAPFALELLALKNEQAETDTLHRVRIVPTADMMDRTVMQFSYKFKSEEDLDAAVSYWQTRLMIIKIALTLHGMCTGTERPLAVDVEALSTEQERHIANMIMAWQSTIPVDEHSGKDMIHALIVLWGALSERRTFRAMPSSVIHSWVLRKLRQRLTEFPVEVTPQLLDETSDLLAGGPFVGIFASILGTDDIGRDDPRVRIYEQLAHKTPKLYSATFRLRDAGGPSTTRTEPSSAGASGSEPPRHDE